MTIILVLASAAGAQPDTLRLQAALGFDGFYRAGKWVPVFVEISNRSAQGAGLEGAEEFRGQLLMTVSAAEGQGAGSRFIREIEIPPASTKRYVLYIRLPENQTAMPRLVLTEANGRFLADYPLACQPLPRTGRLIVAITEGLGVINLPRFRDRMDPQVNARLAPADLPDFWAAWDSADMILVPGWPAAGMSADRIDALLDWVQMGGTLVLAGGQHTDTYTEDAKPILPVSLRGISRLWEFDDGSFRLEFEGREFNRPGTRSYAMTRSEPLTGTDVLLAQEGYPLVARRRHGLGQIVFLALDLQSASPAIERYIMGVWQSLDDVPGITSAEYSMPATYGSLKTLTGRAARPPNQFLLIILSLVYMIIVGPVNFTILARYKRYEYAWVSLPVIVLTFFVLLYGFGRWTRGSESILRELSIRTFHQDSSLGRSVTVASAFTANPGRYFFFPRLENQTVGDAHDWFVRDPISVADMFPTPIGQVIETSPLASEIPVVGFDPRQRALQVNAWQLGAYDARNLVLRGPARLDGRIAANLRWEDEGITGRIANETESDFEDSWIAIGGLLLHLGPFASGEQRELDRRHLLRFPPGHGGLQASGSDVAVAHTFFGDKISSRIQSDDELNWNNFGEIMRTLWRPPVTGDFLPPMSGRFLFIGFHQETGGRDVYTNIEPDNVSRGTITMVELDILPRDNRPVRMPTPMLNVNLVSYETATGGSFNINRSGHLEMRSSEGIFAMELPFRSPRLAVTEIFVHPNVNDQLAEETLTVEVFRYLHPQGWVPVRQGEVLRNDGYALPVTGRMYLRVRSRPNDPGSMSSWTARKTITSLGVTMTAVYTSE